MDKAAHVDVAVPEHPEQFQEHAVMNDQPVHADQPRHEVRPPTWKRDFVPYQQFSKFIDLGKRHLLNHAYGFVTI